MDPIRVLIADDDPAILEVLRMLVSSDPSMDFVDPYAYLAPAVFERLLADYERHGGHVWPGMRAHIAHRASLEPVISGLYGLETGRADLIDNARTELSRGR